MLQMFVFEKFHLVLSPVCSRCNSHISNFSGNVLSREVNFPRNKIPMKWLLMGSQLSWEVNLPWKSNYFGSKLCQNQLSWEVTSQELNFPGKSTFPGSQLSKEVNFPGKSTFPGSQLSREVNFPRSQLSREVNYWEVTENDCPNMRM